ncbi:hypothetical protein ACFL2B_00550 [Patescibacteria group bacterium]
MNKRTTILINVVVFGLVFILAMPAWAATTMEEPMPTTTDEPNLEELNAGASEELPATPTTTIGPKPEFAKAEEVQESTSRDAILAPGGSDYYMMPLNAGYQAKVVGEANGPGALQVNLYAESGELLSTSSTTTGAPPAESFYYKGATIEEPTPLSTVYIEVTAEAVGGSAEPTNYTVRFERVDRSDAYADTDAGADFTTALDLQLTGAETSFAKNFLGKNACGVGKYCSTDGVDFYMLSLADGEELSLAATPASELALDVTLYNENNRELETAISGSSGGIAEFTYTSDENQTVYLQITSDQEEFFGSYALDAEVATGVPTTSPTTAAPVDTTPATAPPQEVTTPEQGFNIWDYQLYIIIGGIAIAGVIVFLVFRARKKKPAAGKKSGTDVEKLREQMRTGKNPEAKSTPKAGDTLTMRDHLERKPAAAAPGRQAPPPSKLPGAKQVPVKAAPPKPPAAPTSPLANKPEAARPSPTKGRMPAAKSPNIEKGITGSAQKDIDDIFGT